MTAAKWSSADQRWTLPKQGSREPWKLKQSYHYDRRRIQKGAIDDGVLEFQS